MISVNVPFQITQPIEETITKVLFISITVNFITTGSKVTCHFKLQKKKNKKLSNLQVDPSLFLQEQLNKPPCRNYTTQGYCEFGLLCKFCHITLDPSTGKVFFFFYNPTDCLYTNVLI